MRFKKFMSPARGFKFNSEGTALATNAGAAAPAADQKTQAGNEGVDVFNGLNLGTDEINAIKSNKKVLDVFTSLMDSKRDANNEARERRLELDRIKLEQANSAKKVAEEQGKFKELYEQSEKQLKDLQESVKVNSIRNKIEVKAIQEGIKNPDYLKLFDLDGLEVDDSGNVKGLDKKFKDFKASHPDLFKTSERVEPTSTRPQLVNSMSDVSQLKEIANKDRSNANIARYFAAVSGAAKNGV